jgi:hypothetical protein
VSTARSTTARRFRQVLARGLARAEREQAEQLARIRAMPALPDGRAENRRIMAARRRPRRRRLPLTSE